MSDEDLIRRGDALAAVYEADSLELVQHGENRIADRIAALPAVTVAVKPLVWEFEQEDVQVANTSVRHQYRIVFDHRATVGAWMWFCDGQWICCETEEAAKAAAQADYEARILAALEPVAAPDPAAIREALLSLPAVYAHQINTGVREVYDPLQRFYTMESVLAAITEATK